MVVNIASTAGTLLQVSGATQYLSSETGGQGGVVVNIASTAGTFLQVTGATQYLSRETG